MAPAEALAALIEAAERLAATDELPGPSRLWAGEEGEALATRLAEVQAALPLLPDQRRDVLPGLLDAVLEGAVVRSRRALRGRDGTEHPRVFIWGLLEARLQTADVMVLGGLAEGVWPPASDPGPWLSRPMRATVGLPSPEEIVGQAAHDFVACAVRRADRGAVLPAAAGRRAGGAGALADPAGDVAGRAGGGPAAASGRVPGCARWISRADGPRPVRPPRPCPPVALRPRRLSVTEIETWLRDPYAIHARHVLRLTALRAARRGDRRGGLRQPGACRAAPFPRASTARAGRPMRRSSCGGRWRGRWRRPICARRWPRGGRRGWTGSPTGSPASRRSAAASARRWRSLTEASGTLELARPGGLFRLTGRADRIERRRDGGLAILDYKTGTPPSQKEVDAGLAPQLLLEAAMAEAGAFGAGRQRHGGGADLLAPDRRLPAGRSCGRCSRRRCRRRSPRRSQRRARRCVALIDAYDAPDRCYLSQPQPGFAPRFSDYAQLARVAEWAAAGDEG